MYKKTAKGQTSKSICTRIEFRYFPNKKVFFYIVAQWVASSYKLHVKLQKSSKLKICLINNNDVN